MNEAKAVCFGVMGAVPSKANFRWSNTERGKRRWQRIKEYETLVGWHAKAAGARCRPGYVATVRVWAFRQRSDADNILKVLVDGLRKVAFPDDSPKYLEGVMVMHRPDDGNGKRLEVEIRYKEAA